MRRVLACGGRDYKDEAFVFLTMDTLHSEDRIGFLINGGARGADWFALRWARARGVAVEVYKADWKAHGLAAGPIRNQQMLREGRPDIVIAFPGGAGTADMIRIARDAKVPVLDLSTT